MPDHYSYPCGFKVFVKAILGIFIGPTFLYLQFAFAKDIELLLGILLRPNNVAIGI